jgi:hypothetical protein
MGPIASTPLVALTLRMAKIRVATANFIGACHREAADCLLESRSCFECYIHLCSGSEGEVPSGQEEDPGSLDCTNLGLALYPVGGLLDQAHSNFSGSGSGELGRRIIATINS